MLLPWRARKQPSQLVLPISDPNPIWQDQVEHIHKLSDAHLALVSDLREVIRERALLEREYAAKLQALAKRASDKKARRMASVVLGDDPSRSWDESVIRKSTLDNALTQFIACMDGLAFDHVALADALSSQIVDELRSLERKQGEQNKKQSDFFQQVVADRDRIYAERKKSQQKYYDDCLEFEGYRQKTRATADHSDKTARQLEQLEVEMQNSKSAYLISTSIANGVVSGFYSTDIPELEDQIQQIQAHSVSRFVDLMKRMQSLHSVHVNAVENKIDFVRKALDDVDIVKDQKLFVEYNIRPFTHPANLEFEPCEAFYEKAEFSAEPEPKVYLQNRLRIAREKVKEHAPLVAAKEHDVKKLKDVILAYRKEPTLGDTDEVLENVITAQHQLTMLRGTHRAATAEVVTISDTLKGDEGTQKPHAFKSTSFSIPTQCAYCKSSIWGLSKQGKTCKSCNISVHSKCELKVPADCGLPARAATRVQQTQPPVRRISTKPETPITTASPSVIGSSVIHSSPAPSLSPSLSRSHKELVRPSMDVLYDFKASSEFEISVVEGSTVWVIEEDDGSGWVKVSDGQREGLVPASYLSPVDSSATTIDSSVKESRGNGLYVRALYDYEAQGPDELSLTEGDYIELSEGPVGGMNFGNGWWEGYDNQGKKGVFPETYVVPC